MRKPRANKTVLFNHKLTPRTWENWHLTPELTAGWQAPPFTTGSHFIYFKKLRSKSHHICSEQNHGCEWNQHCPEMTVSRIDVAIPDQRFLISTERP